MPEPPANADPGPVTPLSYLHGWEFEIVCGRCRHIATLTASDLATRHGAGLKAHEVISRLRCAAYRAGGRCGAKPSQVVLAQVDRRGKSVRVLREIEVLRSSRRTSAWAAPP